MSISLPNGTILAAPSSSHTHISAAVTRILLLQRFSSDLKTRDLQAMFKEWQNEKGGFVIKWIDDISALVVFADASIAKRAYLAFLLSPPPNFAPPASIRPYDRPDAAQIIQSLQARAMGHRSSMSSALTSGAGLNNLNTDSFTANPANAPHHRTQSFNTGGLSGFTMPATGSASSGLSGSLGKSGTLSNRSLGNTTTPVQPPTSHRGHSGGMGSFSHQRTSSSSSSWGRQSLSGAFNFPTSNSLSSNGHGKLSTHMESPNPQKTASRSTSSSSGSGRDDPIVVVDPGVVGLGGAGSNGRFGSGKMGHGQVNNGLGIGMSSGVGMGRRESGSADKALIAVQKALGLGVEA